MTQLQRLLRLDQERNLSVDAPPGTVCLRLWRSLYTIWTTPRALLGEELWATFILTLFFSFLKKTLFKVAFHGGTGSAWSGLMQTLEVKGI